MIISNYINNFSKKKKKNLLKENKYYKFEYKLKNFYKV
jgi:hypothetical protein